MSDVIKLTLQANDTIKLEMRKQGKQSLLIGNSGGTRDYEHLYNKPRLNGKELVGDVTFGAICKTTEEWDNMPLYVPEYGSIIVYTDHGTNGSGVNVPGVKIGDGLAYLVDLPFCGEEFSKEVSDALAEHEMNQTIHVSTEDRTRWDNKLNYDLIGEKLVLNRL